MEICSSWLDVSKFKKDFTHLYRKRHELIDEDAPILNDIVEKITSVNYSIVAFLKSVDSIEDAHIQEYCRCAAIAQLFNAHLDYSSGYPYVETSSYAKEIILIQCKPSAAVVSKYGDIIIDEGVIWTHSGANYGLGFIVRQVVDGIVTQHYGFIANNGAMILPCVFDGFDTHLWEINPIYNNGCFSVRIYGYIHSIDKEKLQEIIDNYDDERKLYCISNDILFAIRPSFVPPYGCRKGNIADLKPLLSQLLVSKEDLQNIQL